MLLVRCPVVWRCVRSVFVIVASIRLPCILLEWIVVLWLLSTPRLISVSLWLVGLPCGKSRLRLGHATVSIAIRLPFRI